MYKCPECGGTRWECYATARVKCPVDDHGEDWSKIKMVEPYSTEDFHFCWKCGTAMQEVDDERVDLETGR